MNFKEPQMIDLRNKYEDEQDFGQGSKFAEPLDGDLSQLLKVNPPYQGDGSILKAAQLETPLGPMIAIANEDALWLLKFADPSRFQRQMKTLQQQNQTTVIPGYTKPLYSIERELALYFKGDLKEFKTPMVLWGTPFQKRVWEELIKIPAGMTRSYAAVAQAIGKPTAFRAVAQANGANKLTIIIPCHRVINSSGGLGGYGAGIARKQWLLQHEQKWP
jgi:AraC family transcriptional regulator, regulatory protein of adaptative response / methylated-DNA-[protein]-cysteine methyltransferase